ncbi:MAG: tetratricopeptide repeat protein [Moorea sp. SIO1F2]|uniref:tetratricopeptide repeat protein n=1 Tax=Moorena sp. SIO1F2 TaxID=2607819 RepID=UPI0013B677FB|nr:tetratricopeptide repeat protein [Moorena sp. SIO1F2]NET83331.1 tetratricopeptide repeat protein [Moorena sp. SIO1F2]
MIKRVDLKIYIIGYYLGIQPFEIEPFDNAYYQLSEYNQAIKYYQQALAIHREVNNRQKEAITLKNLGRVYKELGDYYQSSWFWYGYFTKGLTEYNQAGGVTCKLKSLLGKIFSPFVTKRYMLFWADLGRSYKGLSVQKIKEGSIWEFIFPKIIGIRTLSSKLFRAHVTPSDNQAIEYYQQALAIYREVNNQVWEVITLNNLGEVYCQLGKYDQAIDYYQQALEQIQVAENLCYIPYLISPRNSTIYSRLIPKPILVWKDITLNNLGEVYCQLGKYDQAIDYYQQALEQIQVAENLCYIPYLISPRNSTIYSRLIPKPILVWKDITLNNLGQVYCQLEKYYQAPYYYGKVLDYYYQVLTITKDIDDLTVRCTNSSMMPTVCRQLSYFLDGLSTIIVRLLIGHSIIFGCLEPLPFKHFSSLAFFDSS